MLYRLPVGYCSNTIHLLKASPARSPRQLRVRTDWAGTSPGGMDDEQ